MGGTDAAAQQPALTAARLEVLEATHASQPRTTDKMHIKHGNASRPAWLAWFKRVRILAVLRGPARAPSQHAQSGCCVDPSMDSASRGLQAASCVQSPEPAGSAGR